MRSENEIIDEIKCLLSKIHKVRSENDGFNPFQVATDKWRHENYHSRIIAKILDPRSGHGQGTLFLGGFIDYLIEISKDQKNDTVREALERFKGNIEKVCVKTEAAANVDEMKGRVDIRIEVDNKVIIVENKINGATDQKLQLDRYGRANAQKEIAAIVYLKAYKTSHCPKTTESVKKKLILIAGAGEKSLANVWLNECFKKVQCGVVRTVLSQYIDLLQKQADGVEGDDLSIEIIKSIGQFAKARNYKTSRAIGEIDRCLNLDLMTLVCPSRAIVRLVQRLCNSYLFEAGAINDIATVYYPLILTVPGRNDDVMFALDLNCNEESQRYGFSFHIRHYGEENDLKKIAEIMNQLEFHLEKRGRMERFWKKIQPLDLIFLNPEGLVSEMNDVLKKISSKKTQLEAALSKKV